jgi:type I restriction enzyme, S subunit
MNSFSEISLKDAVSFVVDNRGRSVPVQDVGIPLISTACISNEELHPDLSTERYVSDEIYRNWFRSHPQPGDIILTNKGSKNGEIALVPDPVNFCIAQDMVALRANSNLISPAYLFAILRSRLVQLRIKALNVDAVIPHFKKTDFDKLLIPLPSRRDQDFIGRVYLDISKKIELNRKTNETLEAMAKALFKSWFVDFDPVKAKAEGRPTGLPAEISDLFPDSFEDSELGEIPSGWSVEELGDCSLDISSGRRPKGGIDKNLAFGIPSIGAESIAPVGQFDFSKTKWVDAAFAESAIKGWIQNYDVALYKDGGKPGEFRPRTALYGDGFPFERAMVNEHVFLLRSSQLGQPYLYYLFNFDLVLAQIIHKGSSKGAQPGLNQDEVRTSSFVKPVKGLLDIFNRTIESGIRKQLLLGKECQALSELRDSLLPKLISGEIRIPDAEKMLEEVGI